MVKQGKGPGLSGEEERFVEQLREQYVPDPMTPARRAAFDESLRTRREGRGWRTGTWAPLAAAAAALVLAVWLVTSPRVDDDVPTAEVADEWAYALLISTEFEDTRTGAGSETLPEDYLAIESLLLGS
jgi:hypothetical protein